MPFSRSKKTATSILCVIFQIHQVVKGVSVASESTVGIGEKVSTLKDPDKTAVYHALRCLAQQLVRLIGL
jgi:hypothetical protein